MPFLLRFHDDQTTGLEALCDVCGKPAAARGSTIYWTAPLRQSPGENYPFKIVCADDRCEHELARQGDYPYSQDLDTAIHYLLQNTHFDPVIAWKKAHSLSLL